MKQDLRRLCVTLPALGLALLCGVAEAVALGIARRRVARYRGIAH